MKMKSLLPLLVVFLAGQFFFSCSSGEPFRFTGTNPEARNKVKAKPAPPAVAATPNTITAVSPVAVPQPAIAPARPVLEAHAAVAAPVRARNKPAPAPVPAVAPRLSPAGPAIAAAPSQLAQAREKLASLSKAEKKELKRELRQAIAGEQQTDTSKVLLIILAILIPPLAVGLKEGIGSRFWISLLLTLLFFLPGVIYALLVVTDTI
jgi:uncharacterized membrane protein YqaE (UPF0057 family)